jgi:antitoxin ParD1/3/4
MPAVKKLSIALTQEFAADIDQAVASGEFASTSEVIRDALRTWKRARQAQNVAIEELRTLWRDGVASGNDGELDGEDIKRRGRERLAARREVSR